MKRHLKFALSAAVIGVSTGFLTGLSVSPVVQVVLTSVLALVTALVSVMSGVTLEHDPATAKPRVSIDPMPTAVFAFTLAIGACFGVMVRTHAWLGPDIPNLAKQAGVPQADIYKQMIAQMFPPTPLAQGPSPKGADAKEKADPKQAEEKQRLAGSPFVAGLYSERLRDECSELTVASPADLRQQLHISADSNLQALESIKDDAKLGRLVRTLCASLESSSESH